MKLKTTTATLLVTTALVGSRFVYSGQVPNDGSVPGKSKKAPADEATMRALIKQLGDDSFEKREAAQKRLTEIGEPSLELLQKAAKESADLETRDRSEKLVHEIENRLYGFAWSIRGHNKRPNRIVLTPDGKRYVSSGYDALCMGDAATGKIILKFGASPTDRFYQDIAISADGKRALVGADDKIVRLFDLETGNELLQFIGHQAQIKGVAILPGEKQAISGGKDKVLRLWDMETGKQVTTFAGVAEGVRCMKLSPDGVTLAVGYYTEAGDTAGRIRLWHVESKKELRELVGHKREITRVAFASDGKRVVSSSFDGTVRIWEVASGKELKRFECGNVMESAYFVDGDRRIVCSGKETVLTVQLWDVERGKGLLRSPAIDGGARDVAALAGGGRALAAGVDGTIRLWQWKK